MRQSPHIGIEGLYRLILRDGFTDAVKHDTDWFGNLITNSGMGFIGSTVDNYASYCEVGSSIVPADVTQTALVMKTGDATYLGNTYGYNSIAPYYTWTRFQYRVAAGIATGTIGEVGVRQPSVGTLFSRSVLSPTFTKGISDVLDIYYELRFYPPTMDVAGSVNLGAGSYSLTSRAANIDTPGAGAPVVAFWMPGNSVVGRVSLSQTFPATGSIGSIQDQPSSPALLYGTAQLTDVNTGNNGTTWYKNLQLFCNYNVWNVPGGFKSIELGFGACTFQVQFSPNVVKTNLDLFSLIVRVSWTRYTP